MELRSLKKKAQGGCGVEGVVGTGKTTKGNATASPCGMGAKSSPGHMLYKAPSKSI